MTAEVMELCWDITFKVLLMQRDFPFKVHDSVLHILPIAYLEATDSSNAISSDPLAPHQQANSAQSLLLNTPKSFYLSIRKCLTA